MTVRGADFLGGREKTPRLPAPEVSRWAAGAPGFLTVRIPVEVGKPLYHAAFADKYLISNQLFVKSLNRRPI